MTYAVTIMSLRLHFEKINKCMAQIPRDLPIQCIDPVGRDRQSENQVTIWCETQDVIDRLREFKAGLEKQELIVTLKLMGSS